MQTKNQWFRSALNNIWLDLGHEFFIKTLFRSQKPLLVPVAHQRSAQTGRAGGTWCKSNYNGPDMFEIIFD